MAVRVAINGFGRIGRLVLRAAYEHKHTEIEVVGINDLGPVETNAHLLRYDSVHGRFPGEVTTGDNWMDIGRGKIRVTAERDPAKLPWRELGRRCRARMHRHLHEARGRREAPRSRRQARRHLGAGRRRGHDNRAGRQSGGSKARAQSHLERVLHDQLFRAGGLCPASRHRHRARLYDDDPLLYRAIRSLVDGLHSDLRRARTAAQSMIPTSTGAARAVGLVLPALKGKLDGTAIRVPTANVSLIDFTFDAARDTSGDEVNSLMEEAAALQPVARHYRHQQSADRLGRLQPRPAQLDLRCDADPGPR